jgi:hypothetical protein
LKKKSPGGAGAKVGLIGFVGLVMIAVGVWSLLLFEAAETVPLADYLTAIGTTAGGLAMGGLAQALRLLLEMNRRG